MGTTVYPTEPRGQGFRWDFKGMKRQREMPMEMVGSCVVDKQLVIGSKSCRCCVIDTMLIIKLGP